MTRRPFVLAVAVAAAAGCAVPAGASALTLTSGKLTDRAGAPTAGEIAVYAAPIEDGEEVMVGNASARPDGIFTVTGSPTAADPAYRRPDGIADFRAVARYPDGSYGWWRFSARLTGTGPGLTAEDPGPTSNGQIAHAFPKAPSIVVSPSTPPSKHSAHSTAPMPHQGCVKGSTPWEYETRPTMIGELNNAYGKDGTTAEVLYGEEGSTTTEFSVAEIAANGSYKITGSLTRSSGGRAPFRTGTNRWSRKLYIGYSYRKRTSYLTCGYGGDTVSQTEVEPYKWEGGASTRRQTGVLNKCYRNQQTRYPGRITSFDRHEGAAERYEQGVEVFDIALSTQTDYSTTMRTTHRFRGRRGSPHFVCGYNNATYSKMGTPGPMRSGRVLSGGRPR